MRIPRNTKSYSRSWSRKMRNKVTSKGDITIWTDKLTGYSVDDTGADFGYSAKLKEAVRVTAKLVEGKNDSRFVLTYVK